VNADHRGIVARHPHRLEQARVVDQDLIVHLGQNQMGGDIDARGRGAAVPILERRHRTAAVLVGEVDQCRRAAKGRRLGAGRKSAIVRATPKSQPKWVCTSTPPGRTSSPVASWTSHVAADGEIAAHRPNAFVLDQNIRDVIVGRGDDVSAIFDLPRRPAQFRSAPAATASALARTPLGWASCSRIA
jgi:hypothetical protein